MATSIIPLFSVSYHHRLFRRRDGWFFSFNSAIMPFPGGMLKKVATEMKIAAMSALQNASPVNYSCFVIRSLAAGYREAYQQQREWYSENEREYIRT
ncbi:hypothetical protein KCP78_19195 [Salmonella enterica subsp. enterica]|nr:hypothetical protein KCP78_19195 [Salmonella enterica subsp. enterica]